MTKDTAMNIRISSQDLELIKKSALEQGFEKYSEWCLKILLEATGKKSDVYQEIESLKNRIVKIEETIAV